MTYKTTKDIPATARCCCGVIKKGWKSDGRMICISCHRPLWRTMDTAPKNETDILLLTEDGATIGWWVKKTNEWCYQSSMLSIVLPPTYWMPMPEGPKE